MRSIPSIRSIPGIKSAFQRSGLRPGDRVRHKRERHHGTVVECRPGDQVTVAVEEHRREVSLFNAAEWERA